MTGDEIDDDEYVANLLKQDAQRTAKQYKLVGMDAFRSNRYVRNRARAPLWILFCGAEGTGYCGTGDSLFIQD
jgi:hypothetical protein